MRHNKKFNHLGRKSAHRKAMLANMATSLVMYKRIKTTVAKAKALKMYFEPLVTKSKEDSTHSRRTIFSYLKDKTATAEMFRTIAPKVGDRPGGYTRILRTGFRLGDAADMCIIELVDFNENYSANAPVVTKAKTRRSRAGVAAKADGAQAEGSEAAVAPKPAAKPAAKKPVAKPAIKKAPVKAAAPKTAASKKTATKGTTTKKG